MKNEKQIIDYMNAVFQGASTAAQSIADILPKVTDKELKKELKKEQKEYEGILAECRDFAKRNNLEVKDNNFFEKAKLWTTIKLSTLTNNETRHIAEMMLIGTNMGLITCYKDKYDHRGVSEDLDIIIEKLENLEVQNFDALKPYLNVDEE